jgi:hypothetical protein
MVKRILPGCIFLLSTLLGQTPPHQLQDVHKIFVDSFGDAEHADLVRSKVISKLVRAGRFEIVTSADQADAILTGVSQVSASQSYHASATPQYASSSGGTRYHASAGVQLIGRDQQIIWADDASNSLLSRSATSSLAERIVKDLNKALSKDIKAR